MKRLRRCKIVATLGPASDTREVLAKLFVAGVDVFRINMSHASHDGMRERIRMIRSLEEEYNRPIGILVDLQGPKLRVGTFAEGGLTLEKGATFVFDSDPTPGDATRAEVSDVATAVFEGADAVMLSAESASGQFPVEAVETMNRIAEEVERDSIYRTVITAQRTEPEATGADAIAAGARDVAETLDLKAIVAWTASGSTVFRLARERPQPPVLALTPNRDAARRLCLVWGVHAVVTKDAHDVDDMAKRACKFASREGFAKEGDRVIIVAGVPFGTPGATNMMRIAFVRSEAAGWG